VGENLIPVRWVGSSQRDLRAFPPEVRSDAGIALYAAQQGETDPAAKPLKGFGGHSVVEILAPFDGNIWRAVYTVPLSWLRPRSSCVSEEIEVGASPRRKKKWT
jgi:phage-related protein